ncbi:potassium-transporting ATPase subunit C [Jatrophihabitans telluris]|uniref:Potassium-transporting ATPase KdpC subunit n=1 Tax=Jatrophihabitans telluris TaxID=2038343 RepID=A0ABY4QZI4_9ACTN|nr:potassium-transporting ATPase subunit C [Jatrophihabitans telluris]UQX88999.1 potassium-transporting ATPase subunit C [Jatrophihabitans telluris]
MRSHLRSFRTLAASLRMLLIFTVIVGVAYPLLVTAIAQLPGLRGPADGSRISADGRVVGSKLLGQNFTDGTGRPLPQYFQPRPSASGASGYDPTTSGASNLGPESVVDVLPDPAGKADTGKLSLLTQVCSRSVAIGRLYGVDGSRPFCTPDGVGAVLAVFWSGPGYFGTVTRVVSLNQTGAATPFISTFRGVKVELAQFGQDYSRGQVVPVRGPAPATPAVPADAVTASGSGLDPEISPAYAALQEATVASARRLTIGQVDQVVRKYIKGRDLGFLGEPRVNVLQVNLALDAEYPVGEHTARGTAVG